MIDDVYVLNEMILANNKYVHSTYTNVEWLRIRCKGDRYARNLEKSNETINCHVICFTGNVC